jgi:hypothetical protein
MREHQVRICERLGVKFPGPTRQKRSKFSRIINMGRGTSFDHDLVRLRGSFLVRDLAYGRVHCHPYGDGDDNSQRRQYTYSGPNTLPSKHPATGVMGL